MNIKITKCEDNNNFLEVGYIGWGHLKELGVLLGAPSIITGASSILLKY